MAQRVTECRSQKKRFVFVFIVICFIPFDVVQWKKAEIRDEKKLLKKPNPFEYK